MLFRTAPVSGPAIGSKKIVALRSAARAFRSFK